MAVCSVAYVASVTADTGIEHRAERPEVLSRSGNNVQVRMFLEARRVQALTQGNEDLQFCYDMLNEVSRSFAIVIQHVKRKPACVLRNTDKDRIKGTVGHRDDGPVEGADLVTAAEKCAPAVIHPGDPLDPDEKGLDKLIPRAEKFN